LRACVHEPGPADAIEKRHRDSRREVKVEEGYEAKISEIKAKLIDLNNRSENTMERSLSS